MWTQIDKVRDIRMFYFTRRVVNNFLNMLDGKMGHKRLCSQANQTLTIGEKDLYKAGTGKLFSGKSSVFADLLLLKQSA